MSEDSNKIKLIDHFQVWQSEDVLQIRGARKSLVLRGGIVKTVLPKLLPLLKGHLTRKQVMAELQTLEDINLVKAFQALESKELIEDVLSFPEVLKLENENKLTVLAKHFKNTTNSSFEPILALYQSPILVTGDAVLIIPIVLNLVSLFAKRIQILSSKISAEDVAYSRYLEESDIGSNVTDVVQRHISKDHNIILSQVQSEPVSVEDWSETLKECELVVTAHNMPVIFNKKLENLNQAVVRSGVKWLPVATIDNKDVQLGPSVIPAETACYKCFEYRFRSNLTHLESYDLFASTFNALEEKVDFGMLAPYAEIVANLAAIEAMKLLSPEHIATSAGKIVSISLDGLCSTTHPVLKIPKCSHCNEYSKRCPERVWG